MLCLGYCKAPAGAWNWSIMSQGILSFLILPDWQSSFFQNDFYLLEHPDNKRALPGSLWVGSIFQQGFLGVRNPFCLTGMAVHGAVFCIIPSQVCVEEGEMRWDVWRTFPCYLKSAFENYPFLNKMGLVLCPSEWRAVTYTSAQWA